MPPGHLEIVQGILQKYLPPDVNAYVFGSRADWTTKDSSDLDLALEGDSELEYGVVSALEGAFDESDLPYAVDVVDLNLVGDSFRRIVDAQKIPLPAPDDGISVRWPRLRFGDCASLVRDTASPADLEDMPYVGLEHIGKSAPALAGCGAAKGANRAKTRFRRGDILFGKLPPYFRKVMRAGFDGICPADMWAVRPTNGINADFLFYVMASSGFVNSAARDPEGARMPHAEWGRVSQYEAPIPPLGEQHAIAHVLRTLDERIELNRQMNKTLEGMARALFGSWFVDFDPIRAKMDGRWRRGASLPGLPARLYGLFPDGLVDSDLGKIPNGWTVNTFENCFSLTMGQSPPSNTCNDDGRGLPFFQDSADFGSRYPKNGKYCAAPARIAQAGDTLVSVRAPAGAINMAWEECCVGRGIAVIRHKSRSRSFTYYSMWSLQHALQQYEQTGTAFGAITRKQLEMLPVIEPPIHLVGCFEAHVLALDERIRLNTSESVSLMRKRDALLPKLVSGELRAHPDRVKRSNTNMPGSSSPNLQKRN